MDGGDATKCLVMPRLWDNPPLGAGSGQVKAKTNPIRQRFHHSPSHGKSFVVIHEMSRILIGKFRFSEELQCLQSSRSQVGGSNLDSCVEETFQKTLNLWTGRSQLPPETFKSSSMSRGS